ncbi:MAG TPA: tyrosine-protein phosphatase [Verrucomicrobiae bacterium]
MNWHRKICPVVAALLLFAATVAVPARETTNRPASWAQKVEVAGVKNCFQVTTNLYRGAQPTAEGMAHLQALGVRLIVDLRMLRSDRHKLHGTGLKSVNLGMAPWRADPDDVVQFLKAVTDTNNLPAFVHCAYGADRTGLMCAMYRIVVCDWTKQEAIAEMKNGGFHFSWNTLVSFIEKADVAEFKRRVGLSETDRTMSKKK